MDQDPKITIKDSVFTNLFSQKKYMRQLYLTLHPEDTIEEDELEEVTLENILVDDIYNDLGFLAKKRLITLAECQSTWNNNMALRLLLYYVVTIQKDYVGAASEKLYGSAAIELPRPELYVVYTGDRQNRPDTITLSGAHFDGEHSDIEVTVHMLYGGNGHDIISQYVEFAKTIDRWTKSLGRTNEALVKAIAECQEKDVLREYLTDHESEVLSIMTTLFDQDKLTKQMNKRHYEEGRAEGREEGVIEGRAELVKNVLAFGNSVEQTASILGISVDEVRKLSKL